MPQRARSAQASRYVILHSVLVLCSFLLVACSGKRQIPWPEGVPPQNPQIAEDQLTLRVWLADDYAAAAPIRDLVADFEQAYPNIDIELTGYLWEELPGRLRLAISQGDPPDLAHQHAFAMGAQGLAQPLDDLWQQWEEADTFLPSAMDDVTWQGIRYGVPLDSGVLLMIYNRAAFVAAGLPLPGPGYTLSQLREDLRALTVPADSRYGMALSSSARDLYGLICGNGGTLLVERNGRVVATFDDPRVVEIVRFYTNLGWQDRLGSLPPPQLRQSDHPIQLFSQRKVAVFFSGPWALVRLKQDAPPDLLAEVATAPLPLPSPTAPGGSVQTGSSLFVPRGAQHRAAAFELMKWAVSDRYALPMARKMGRFPVRAALYATSSFDDDPLLAPFLAQLKTAHPYRIEAYPAASMAWSEAVRAAFAPDANLEVILAEAQRRAQSAIDAVQTDSSPPEPAK